MFSGDDNPNGNSLRQLNITSLVQSWADGAPNNGVVIVPEIIGGNDDGISIWTSESGNGLFRPRLEITYLPPATYDPADFNQDGYVDGQDLAFLLSSWGQSGAGDLNGDGVVGGEDLAILLSAWLGR